MKRPTFRGSRSIQELSVQQEQEKVVAAYMEQEEEERGDADEEEEGEELVVTGCGLGERKRRLAAEQVRALERSFEADNKLDPERKARIAGELLLHPRQVAVWFQNRRARWKTKQLERDFAALRARHDSLRRDCDALRADKDALAAELRELREKADRQMAVKLEAVDPAPPVTTAAAAAVYKDGSTDSDSSAVFNEDASPYSGFIAGAFTSLMSSTSSLSSSIPMFEAKHHESHMEHEGLLSSVEELGAASFFAADEHVPGLAWYGGEGW